MLEKMDPFGLRTFFDHYNIIAHELRDIRQDAQFLKALRRSFFPLSRDVQNSPDPKIFPPFELNPHPLLAGKRVGLVASGGSGALVTLCGIKRALEEAQIDIAAISVCSGSAIWGSMIASGMSAQQMVDESFRLTGPELVDLDWKAVLKFPWTLGKGFSGLSSGRSFENSLDRILKGISVSEAQIPYYTIVLNIDTNEVDYFGIHSHPEEKLSKLARIAISLPLFVRPVKFGNHYYVDGGAVNVFPVDPLLRYEKPFDFIIGVNTLLPSKFRGGNDITGWLERPLSILEVSRQLWHTQHIEAARQQFEKIKDKTLLLEPIPYTEIKGSKFYEVFIDNAKWPDFILRAYYHTKEKLQSSGG